MKNIFAIEPVVTPKTNSNTNTKPPVTNGNSNTNTGSGGGTGTASKVVIPEITNPFKDVKTLPGIADRLITITFSLIVIAAVVVIIISGFRLITSGSDPGTRKNAKTAIIWSLIGLLVAFMSYAIVSIIQGIL